MLSQSIFHNRNSGDGTVKLRLVALMDIFTILVFFLLLSSGQSNTIENAKFIKLPESSSGSMPSIEPVLNVGKDGIWLNDQMITKIPKNQTLNKKMRNKLKEALLVHTKDSKLFTAYEQKHGLPITIMGNKETSFALLRNIMKVCQQADFRDIFLAANLGAAKTN